MLLHRTCLALRCSSHVRQRFAITAALKTAHVFRPSSSSASSDFDSMDICDLRDVCAVRGLDDSGNKEAVRRRLMRDIGRSIKLIKEVRPEDTADGYQSVARGRERARALERAASTQTKLEEIRAKKSKDRKESKVGDVSSRPRPSTSQSSESKVKSVDKDPWHEQYRLLSDYKSREGHCLVPKKHVEGDIRIGLWVIRQRDTYKRGTMPKSRVDLMNEIGFSWDPLGGQWESNFSLLKQYKKREGDCLVPQKHIEDGIKLGNWVDTQRKNYKKGKIPRSRVDLMNGIGFSWAPLGGQWESNFSLLKQYKKREGNCLVPQKHIERGTKLGRWANNQRNIYKKGKLPQSQIDLMNGIGFSWDPLGEQWESNFLLLKQYMEREGHCDFKQTYKEGDVNLGSWMTKQKSMRKRGTLSEERFQRLQELGAPIK